VKGIITTRTSLIFQLRLTLRFQCTPSLEVTCSKFNVSTKEEQGT